MHKIKKIKEIDPDRHIKKYKIVKIVATLLEIIISISVLLYWVYFFLCLIGMTIIPEKQFDDTQLILITVITILGFIAMALIINYEFLCKHRSDNVLKKRKERDIFRDTQK